jgi:hypothetical protein
MEENIEKTPENISDSDIIIKNYLTPSHPTAFSSIGNIHRFYKGKYHRNTIADALATIDTYTLHKEFKKPKF